MSIINNIDRVPSVDEYRNSHILVPFRRFNENYYDNNSIYVPVSNIYTSVSYIREIIEDRYGIVYDSFKRKYEEACIKYYDYSQADKYIYVECKGNKDHNDTYIVFINTEDVDNTKNLIEDLLKNLKDIEFLCNSMTHADLIVPKFYADYRSWRKVYDCIIEYSSALDFKGEINPNIPNINI